MRSSFDHLQGRAHHGVVFVRQCSVDRWILCIRTSKPAEGDFLWKEGYTLQELLIMMGKCLPSARPASSRAHRRRRRNKAGLVPRTQHHTPHLLHILQHIFRSAITFLDDAGSQIFTQAHHEYGGHGQRLILRGWADRGGLLMRGEFHVFKHTSFPHITRKYLLI